jgi:hypothetical protein
VTELTSEEKKKIYEEEKMRLEAQEKLKKETQDKKSKQTGIGCLVIIAVIAVIWIIGEFSGSKNSSSSTPPVQEIKLNAAVRFDGAQFILTNNDAYNWTDVEVEINGGLIKSGYILKVDLIEAQKTYTVGALQFAKPDGTRFNPFSVKPQSIFITAKTRRGDGSYSGSWN